MRVALPRALPRRHGALPQERWFSRTAAALEQEHYSILGVPRNATPDQVKKAYRSAAKKYHPDAGGKGKGNADMFNKVNEAYKTLSDPQKRQVYDMSSGGAGGASGGGGAAGAGHEWNQKAGGFPGWNNMEFSYTGQQGAGTHHAKMASDLGSMWEDIFGSGTGGAQQGQKARMARYQPQRGVDVAVKLKLDFKEAVEGTKKEVTYFFEQKCTPCRGTGSKDGAPVVKCTVCNGRGKMTSSNGYYHVEQPCTACGGVGEIVRDLCSNCGGKGTVKARTTQQVNVPAGVDTKDRLRVAGKGGAGIRGGAPGNLFIDVIVDNETTFTRDGEDMHVIQPLTVAQAIMGAKIQVPTISGQVNITVPPGTQQGDKQLLRNMGVRKPQKNTVGDMYVHFHIHMPSVTSLTSKQKELLESFDLEMGEQREHLSPKNMFMVKQKYKKMIDFKDAL
eukprot:TRINITY_DN16917_c0_g1_i1.p2 TRINITY_DN16917_c0_g1~~TRINITY_DN16917_c0_g1_i1.p2  ORF type:complete len:447 (+),score=154.10 TRINITY_DN16917_c0_g1_i1:54-1394(+)